MSTIKTLENDTSVEAFLDKIEDEAKKADSFKLLDLFCNITGEPARMWGSSIIGFGTYHYKYEPSGHEGDSMLTGFSPRKKELTLYIMPGFEDFEELLSKLGKHKTGKSCLYLKSLGDIDEHILGEIIKQSYLHMKALYPKEQA